MGARKKAPRTRRNAPKSGKAKSGKSEREALQSTLQVKFLLKHSDFTEECFDELFRFFREEMLARRHTRRTSPDRTVTHRKENDKKFVKRDNKEFPRSDGYLR